ncbi:hypothetical protein EHW97_08010 [Aeromicrobium camelliae]|uniref:DUF6318 domain-containing protein n=1 Tax=Aeromicrobium camelliae TaxID=1538144 RepID=A0A3N6X2U6_9ACTN|nr:DUF6318 family protein [Aeromicrobium camelliae]RQN07963.1 hypothetical protein EHW97_08010 [Aeromicrobium camelliae]
MGTTTGVTMIRRLATAMAVTSLLLAGCSSSPSEEKPSPTATDSPTDAPPTMPELALDDSPAGAEAFVRHWIGVFNASARHGNQEWLGATSSPDCSPCSSYAREFKRLAAEGKSPTSDIWTLREDQLETFEDQSRIAVRAAVDVREGASTNSYLFVFYVGEEGPRRMLDITMEPQ